MREVSLREFRTRGAKALQAVPAGETVLLAGQQGPAYFLVPVMGDAALQDRELRRAIAKTSLRESWRLADHAEPLDEEAVDQEIAAVRRTRQGRKRK